MDRPAQNPPGQKWGAKLLGVKHKPCPRMIGVSNQIRNGKYLGSITILRARLDPSKHNMIIISWYTFQQRLIFHLCMAGGDFKSLIINKILECNRKWVKTHQQKNTLWFQKHQQKQQNYIKQIEKTTQEKKHQQFHFGASAAQKMFNGGSLLVMYFLYFKPLSSIVISYVCELHCMPICSWEPKVPPPRPPPQEIRP